MSVHVTSWVWRRAPVAGNELLVLLALADISNDDGVSWPSNGLLAEKTRLSLATVKRMKQRLRERRLLVDDASLGRSNVYRIVMDEVAQFEPLLAQVEPGAQIEPAHSSEPGVAHSSEPGGGSRLSHYTSENRNEPSPTLIASDELERVISVDEGFARFWEVWPRKKSRGDAFKAFRSLMSKVPARRRADWVDQVVAGVGRSVNEWRSSGRPVDKIPYPATWLRAEGWGDAPDVVPEWKQPDDPWAGKRRFGGGNG